MKLIVVIFTISIMLFTFSACNDDDEDSSANPDEIRDEEITNDDSADLNDDANDDTNDDDSAANNDLDYVSYVDPFFGTSGDRGQLHPAASVPFGMMKLGPDTLLPGHAGYNFQSLRITGFSHTRIGGVGCSGAGANLRMMPSMAVNSSRAKKKRRESESATPGYYSVILEDKEYIKIELTTTEHVGLHKYTFSEGGEVYIRMSLNSPLDDNKGSSWSITEYEVSGWVSGANVCGRGRYKFYFSTIFNHPIASVIEAPTGSEFSDAILSFDLAKNTVLMAKVGLSTVSAELAAQDRDLEMPHWDFDLVASEAAGMWYSHLKNIEVCGEEEYKKLFYTMLYRSSMTPVSITGPSGRYRGTDGLEHLADDFTRYHSWSLWDTYRTKYPLLHLIDPARSKDILTSLSELYAQGKADWATDNEPCPTVRTEHAVLILLDGLAKGYSDFGIEEAWEYILLEAANMNPNSPDTIIETACDHWGVARIADHLGDTQTRDEYLDKALDYQDTWIEHFKVMGEDADVMHARGLYEGTLWQYRWAPVHDIEGLVALAGGRNVLRDELIHYFNGELHNHGNEPDIHAPFLFNNLGAAWRTQKIVRDLLVNPVNQWYGTYEKWPLPYHRRIYLPQPKAYIPEMDDDAGTMSAWFVLASIGLYPVTIGQPIYMLTAPIFTKVVLHTRIIDGNGGEFSINALDLSDEKIYIQSAHLNDEPLHRAWLHHDEITEGGHLIFQMGSTPNEVWGAADEYLPPNALNY